MNMVVLDAIKGLIFYKDSGVKSGHCPLELKSIVRLHDIWNRFIAFAGIPRHFIIIDRSPKLKHEVGYVENLLTRKILKKSASGMSREI